YSALDYLIKPVEIEELSQAIDKAIQKRESSSNQRLELLLENLRHDSKEIRKIAISSPEGLQFVRLENLLYLEATGNYTHVHTCDKKKYLSSHSLKIFEEILPVHQFLRIHNSYIINLDYVVKYIRGEGGKVVLEGNVTLDISKRKKADFLKAIRM
ncbi:MAG TPA: LytTR family DNA-binding domain-containing protein, partial [Saprospiraceae bacterium]|nr:LytTR family DNA-binding domain-containing protein [Saprospiraceae bacterium]